MSNIHFISYHFPHIAGHSGYDKITPFLGEPIELSRATYLLGESVLRLPAKLVSWYGGQFEYSRARLREGVSSLSAYAEASRLHLPLHPGGEGVQILTSYAG